MLDIACNQGLNKLLPVYLDHILFPLLTVSSFMYRLNDNLGMLLKIHTKIFYRTRWYSFIYGMSEPRN